MVMAAIQADFDAGNAGVALTVGHLNGEQCATGIVMHQREDHAILSARFLDHFSQVMNEWLEVGTARAEHHATGIAGKACKAEKAVVVSGCRGNSFVRNVERFNESPWN